MSNDPNDDAPWPNRDTDEAEEYVQPGVYEAIESEESVDTDQWVQVNQAHYDRAAAGELVTALVFAIADAKGVDPLDHAEMPPLYESVDAQGLEETFFGPSGAGSRRTEAGAVTFIYDGYKVALRSDGWIFVYEPR